jgi:hypothetical protein
MTNVEATTRKEAIATPSGIFVGLSPGNEQSSARVACHGVSL